MIRNLIGVLVGVAVAILIISFSLMINDYWITYDYHGIPIEQWKSVLGSAKPEFFIALIISSGVACFIGGVVCAMIVKRARTAYAMLVGFILLFFAIADVMIVPGHPWWYVIGFGFIFFPFSWLGVYTVKFIYKKSKKEKKTE